MFITRSFARNCNGIDIHYADTGSGPPIVFLHGFPDFWYSWRKQMPALSKAGFRCIVPDLRGHNETDKPKRIADYDIDVLVADVSAFIERIAGGSAYVVAHDWGGVIAWQLAAQKPERVRKLVILNAPHPTVYRRELRRGAQLMRSWYILAFQVPMLPELVLSSLHYRLLTKAVARNDNEVELYEEAFSQPRALTSALNYYRAAARRVLRDGGPHLPRIKTPTLVLWGERDFALSTRLLDGLGKYAENLQVIRFARAGHWLHIDRADQVNAELLRFL